MRKIFEHVRINIKSISGVMAKMWGILFPLYWGVIFSGYFSSIFVTVANSILVIIILILLTFAISTIYVLNVNHRVVFRSITNKSLEVEFGDIFSSNAEIKVIPVNCCFDTVVDDKLIARNSLHGMLIANHLKHIDYELLCNKITLGLSDIKGNVCSDKTNGKSIRYPTGTIVEIDDGNVIYYLLALTKLDSKNKAYCSEIYYYNAIIHLMNYYDQHGQGKTMAIPNLGAGFSRINQPEQILLEALISAIRMLQSRMRGDIKIIVHDAKRDIISITDL